MNCPPYHYFPGLQSLFFPAVAFEIMLSEEDYSQNMIFENKLLQRATFHNISQQING